MEGHDNSRALPSDLEGIPSDPIPHGSGEPYPSTDRELAAQVRQRFSVFRRRHTDMGIPRRDVVPITSAPELLTTASLRGTVYQELKKRLIEYGIDPQELGERFFAWCLPKNRADAASWQAFLDNPMMTPTDDLLTMFRLKESTALSPQATGDVVYYVRTFAITAEELEEVIEQMIDEGAQSETLTKWEAAADSTVVSKDTILYVRYCGYSSSVTAWNRHAQDLRGRSEGLISYFVRAVNNVCPEVLAAVKIHTFEDATISSSANEGSFGQVIDTRLLDLREQALIAVFGYDTLLNVSLGGKRQRFEPNVDDDFTFAKLRTNFLECLKDRCGPAPASIQDAIAVYATKVQSYFTANNRTGGQKIQDGDAVRELIQSQATPVVFNDRYTLLLSTGWHLPIGMANSGIPFYTGKTMSGELCTEIIDQLASWETGARISRREYVSSMQENHQLPFVEMYPWPKADAQCLPDALRLLRSYLQSVNPMVMLTFSVQTSSAAAGYFQHGFGMRPWDFVHYVAKPFISKYDDIITDQNDEHKVLIVPCFHPAFMRYSKEFMSSNSSIMCKAFMVAWYLASRCAHYAADPTMTSKKDILEAALKDHAQLLGRGTEFDVQLSKTIEELQKGWRASKYRKAGTLVAAPVAVPIGGLVSDVKVGVGKRGLHTKAVGAVAWKEAAFQQHYETSDLKYQTNLDRWNRAKEELMMLLSCERLVGDSFAADRSGQTGDAVRRSQVDRLTGLNLVFLDNSNTKAQPGGLKGHLLRGSENEMCYLYCTNVAQRAIDIPNLLGVHLPKDVNPNDIEWLEDTEIIKKANSNLINWLIAKVVHPNTPWDQVLQQWPRLLFDLMNFKEPVLAKRLNANLTKASTAAVKSYNFVNGQQVMISAAHNQVFLNLQWSNSHKAKFDIKDFRLPVACRPLDQQDARFLYLLPEGLDIRDNSGATLGISAGNKTTMTVSKMVAMLTKNPLGDDFLQLWELWSGSTVDDVLFGAIQDSEPADTISASTSETKAYPAQFFKGTSRVWAATGGSFANQVKAVENSFPIHPGDAMWLFYKFLTETFPGTDEQVIDTGNPDKWPGPKNFFTRIDSWLNDARFMNQPQRKSMKSTFCNIGEKSQKTSSVRVIASVGAAITALFQTSSKKTDRTSKGGVERNRMLYTVKGGIVRKALPKQEEPALVEDTSPDPWWEVQEDGESVEKQLGLISGYFGSAKAAESAQDRDDSAPISEELKKPEKRKRADVDDPSTYDEDDPKGKKKAKKSGRAGEDEMLM